VLNAKKVGIDDNIDAEENTLPETPTGLKSLKGEGICM